MLNHEGNAQPAIDKEEHTHPFGESGLAAKTVVEPIPAGFMCQKRIDYDVRTDENPVYIGFNYKGASSADTNWLIQKVTYDGSDRITLVQVSLDSWDRRTLATYS